MRPSRISETWSKRRIAIPFAAALLVAATNARAEYKIGAGDVLSITVAGIPDLTTKAPVDIDGAASVPLVGQVAVAGLSIADALEKVRSVLPTREFRRRTEDGREYPVIIAPDEIGLSVSEYRPIYLNGDVAHPGAEAYRPGLTVRQAVALAGGYDVLRYKMDNPFLQLADLTSQYNGLWIDYAKGQARVARLQSVLDGSQTIDSKSVIDTPLATGVSSDILRNAGDQLKADNTDFDKESAYLRDAAAKEVERAGILSDQLGKEQEGARADVDDLQRYSELFKKGAVALPILTDARRTVLLSSTRALQTTALLDSVEREQQDVTRKLDRTADARRLKTLQEMQDAQTDLAKTRALLQAVSDKLRYTGMVKSQLVRGSDSPPKVTLIRIVDGRRSESSIGVDAELQPGDTVEIALQMEGTAVPSQ